MKSIVAVRHGDLGLFPTKNIPKGLKKSSTKILMIGNTGNHHSFDVGTFYPHVDGSWIIGYFKAKNTTLFHTDHGVKEGLVRKAKIVDGIYEVRRQVETLHEGFRPVID